MKKLSMLCAVAILFGARNATAEPRNGVDGAADAGRLFVVEADIPVCGQKDFPI